MPEYQINGETFRRKNLYMPCIIGDRFDDLPPTEQVAIYRATYWADNITNSEWPVVLDHDEATKQNRSRLRRKGTGWLMALARIAHLNPELFDSMVSKARELYAEQVEEDFPWSDMVTALAGIRRAEPGEQTVVAIRPGRRESVTDGVSPTVDSVTGGDAL